MEKQDAQFTETMKKINELYSIKLLTDSEYETTKKTLIEKYDPSKKTIAVATV
ncbi:MAG: hypothetical protein IKP66_06605 [Lachnospiraceae bacterium]|nr:hypothetical protein [Lachnospiraceae bacterium]